MDKLRAEGDPTAETATPKLQDLAQKFKNGEITDGEKETFEQLANSYIANRHTGDHDYHGDHPSQSTSYTEYAFYDLPNGLCLEGEASNHQNNFTFHDVLTSEERDQRIEHLKSTAKE